MKFEEWLILNEDNLEEDFIQEFPPENQPLDDDIPDFMGWHACDFEEYCVNRFNDFEEVI